MNSLRRLVVMRHAKAESFAESDAARRLTERGQRDAAVAGHWLAGQGFRPDHALVSSAVRTRQTWESVASAAQWTLQPELDPALYAAGAESALDLMRMIPAEVEQLLVLGHNPTVSYLAQLLDDGAGDPAAATAMGQGYPPAALSVFEFDSDWTQLGYGHATLVAFHVGDSSQRS